MTKHEILSDIAKVFGVHICAITITFSNVEGFLKIASLALAIGYGVWKWRVDYLKNKKDGNNTEKNSTKP
jgi:hypothetical protein